MKLTGRYYEHAEPIESYSDYMAKRETDVLLLCGKISSSIKNSSLTVGDKERMKELAIETITNNI